MNTPHILNAIDADLSGNILIEASAGTGKTYTITTLVLRLLLGLTKSAEALTIDKILIVTFTNAATAELKERIFKRIVDLKVALRHPERYASDEVLQTLLSKIENHNQALATLTLAARQIDQAAIFTIHGFCQRILSQNAFGAGLEFTFELNNELDGLLSESCQNFWRKHCYYFDFPLAELALHYYGIPSIEASEVFFQEPANLQSIVRPYVQNPKLLPVAAEKLTRDSLIESINPYLDLVETVKRSWLESSDDIQTIIEKSDVDKRSYSARHLPNWIQQITMWAEGNSYIFPASLSRFSREELENKTKDGGKPPTLLVFEKIERLIKNFHSYNIEVNLKLFAAAEILREFTALKEQSQQINFDDILIRLSRILQQQPTALIEQIRTTYQAVLIDEFQDTDYYQFSIFSDLFFKAESIPFIMIGDPKQSIYKFRGADIYAYLEAKRQAEVIYTLDTNYRSSERVIQAVNTLFSLHENPFFEKRIPFYPVKAPDSSALSWLDWEGEAQKGMTFLSLQTSVNTEQYLEHLAEHTANEVVSLLDTGKLCHEGITESVLPNDITFLVRGRREADVIKKALLRRGVNAVYLSDRSNVFTSVMTHDLYILLRSLLNSRDFSLIKQSLSSVLYGLSLEEYLEALQDNSVYENYLLERKILREKWDKLGVLGMVRYFIMQRDRLARLRALKDGERFITDLFHVAELLQNKKLPTKELLVAWFENCILEKEHDEQYHQRLESDFDAIKILTVHKSKGLEFPIVFIPFAVTYLRYRKSVPYYDKADEQLKYAFNPSEEVIEQIVAEEYAEAIRLLYVAVTRAKYHCRLGFVENLIHGRGKKSVVKESALGYLLNLSEENCALPPALFSTGVIEEQRISPEIVVNFYDKTSETPLLKAATLKMKIPYSWRFTSFSHLSYQAENTYFDQEKRLDELDVDNINIAPEIITFPKGVNTGNFIHDLLEKSTPDELQDLQFLENALKTSLLYDQCKDDLPFWSAELQHWFSHILHTELTGGLSLARVLASQTKLNELEFLFPVKKLLTARQVNALLNQHQERTVAAELNFSGLTGMLKGFIDLTFKWEGKYYISDYKTNYLGDYYVDYQYEKMRETINHAYYDWQYLLYTVALVKYLRIHDPEFDYAKDFGGIYYLFLRGMRQGESTGIYFVKPEYSLIESLIALFEESE